MIGRITPSKHAIGVAGWGLDFMTLERNGVLRKRPIYIAKDLSESDIEPLLNAIRAIQDKRPKRSRTLPEADVIKLFGN
jgi:hypothetical protein